MKRSNLSTLTTFLIGLITGIVLQRTYTTIMNPQQQQHLHTGPNHGTITHLSKIPPRPTVHIDTLGRPITKQQLIEPFLLPNFIGVSIATFLPGQTMMPAHDHETMHEIFYVLEGKGVFEVDGVEHVVEEGTLLHFAPGERHGIWVREEGKGGEGPMKLLVTGVTVGEKSKDREN